MYETFDHTADLGLRARTGNLEALFCEMAMALFAAIIEDLGTIQTKQKVEVQLVGEDREFLLFDWLKELLFHFDSDHLVFSQFEVRFHLGGLIGTAWGEPLDPSKHPLGHEVKAITYHGLRVEQTEHGWLAEVIVDI